MNWYFEQSGISQGPVPEHDLAGRVQRGEVLGDTLVWHDGMTEWRPVGQVSPDWLQPKAPAAVKPVAAKVSPTTKPLAPSKQALKPADGAGEKQGFFSRLFGKNKKQ